MAKLETRPCMHCSFKFSKEKSMCPSCKQWNIEKDLTGGDGTTLLSDDDDDGDDLDFIKTGPWDPCFGRLLHDDGSSEFGIPKSAVTLLGGKNGAGKSTLVMQVCDRICDLNPGREVLMVSVEEPKRQVRRLGKRLKVRHLNRMRISKGDVDIDHILHVRKPVLVVIDSLPKLCPNMDDAVVFAKRLKEHIEALNIPAILINHINKEEEFAGLEALQHEVDATLIFTVFDDDVRELRSMKNRNGPPARVLFNMTDTGLVERSPEEDEEEEDEEDYE
jgi:DNA repair protein RadA/Sms